MAKNNDSNKKRTGNIIFKNGDMFDNQMDHVNHIVSKQSKVINQLVDSINHANKNWSGIEVKLDKLTD